VEVASPTTPTFQHTVPVSNSLAHNEARPMLTPVPLNKRKAKNISVLKIGFALVVLAAFIGTCYITSSFALSIMQKNKSNGLPGYLSSLPGIWKLALNDPMNDESKGNNWASTPTPFGSCIYKDNAFHVIVNENTEATFHPCIAESLSTSPNTLIFSNFLYQVTMKFVTGDCGGVTFRGQGDGFYYFFICQNRNYTCHNDNTKICNYGLIRYTKDPSSGQPDFTLNPLLTEGFSQQIQDGSHNPYTIAVVAQDSKIDLYVNDQQIGEVKDNNLSRGSIGVLAKKFGQFSTEVAFSDATVWTL
jgi:hypothetical protein